MALTEILLHVDSSESGQGRLAAAKSLAEQHDARLTAVGLPGTPAEGVTEWRDLGSLRQLSLHARYADLTIMGQTDDGEADHVTETVMSVGRPVMVIPHRGHFPSIGRRALIAWNGSREATRAVYDALPLLRRADHVTVLTLDAEHDRVAGADISRTLARHTVNVEVVHSAKGEINVGNALLSRAADCGSDLIVMGAFGHSPLHERMLGGATRHILQHMTVPVLISH